MSQEENHTAKAINMNFKELLTIEDEDATFRPEKKISLVVNEIEKLKKEAVQLLSEETHLEQWHKESTVILDDANELVSQVEEFNKVISNEILIELLESSNEFKNISQELVDVETSLMIVNQLVESDKQFKNIENYRTSGDLHNAVVALTNFTDYLNDPVDGLQYLSFYKTMKSTIVLYWDQVLEDVTMAWRNILNWTEETENKTKKVTLIVNKQSKERYVDVLNALDSSKQIHVEMKRFSNFVLKHMLFPIIHQETSVITESGDANKIYLHISLKSKGRPHYESILQNIKTVFEFLNENLEFEMPLTDCLMRQLGCIISVEFCDVLVKHCLVHTIPNCISELQEYNKVTSQVEKFQAFLSSIHFFSSDNVSILQYANNIDVLFAEKTSQYFLEKARDIMKKDLGDTITVGVDAVTSEELYSFEPSLEEAVNGFVQFLPYSILYFPKCCVSSSVQELIDLIFVTMEQASQGSDLCANRFYYTARYIVELYEVVVPKFHESLLESMPKIVAVFHNNCMYLAHILLTLGAKWQAKVEGREYNYTINFVDQVQKIRDLGCKQLLLHLQTHKKQILDTIRSSDLSSIGVKDLLGENAEQAVRQCLRQLQILKSLWIVIFPLNVYAKLISLLGNVFVDEIIHRVCTVEDIPADIATQLSDIYEIVLSRLPQIYQDESEAMTKIKKWNKMKEMITILNGSLKDIEERWCDGVGPLAILFTPDELRNLIRALFQNTTFRATLLSKIR